MCGLEARFYTELDPGRAVSKVKDVFPPCVRCALIGSREPLVDFMVKKNRVKVGVLLA
jgi:hypothetical protein